MRTIEALCPHPDLCCSAAVESEDTVTVFAVPQPGVQPDEAGIRLHFSRQSESGKHIRVLFLNELPDTSGPTLTITAGLIRLWEELLRISSPGIDDDFFALGGDSLLAIRLLTRIRTRFGVALEIREFFESPTIRTLAPRIAGGQTRQAAPAPIQPGPRRRQTTTPSELLATLPRESVHQLFERQVEQRPDAIALTAGSLRISYRELNRQANGIARELIRRNIPRGALIAIALPRSPELIAALIGILKAGAAFLPLDSSYPPERLGFLLGDSAARLLITSPDRAAHFSNWTGPTLYAASVAPAGDQNPRLPTAPDDLAYVMYTSGSTGTPKGVEIPHRGIVRLLFGNHYARFGPDTVFLQLAPVSFDASTLEIWGALLHGGRCVLYPDTTPVAATLGAILRQEGVTTLWLTSTLFNALIDDDPTVLDPVEQLLTGGEALSVPHVLRALELLPETELINGYGPTESTTFTCCYPIPRQWEQPPATIPIGRPIAWTQVYILDSEMAPVPDGTSGELFIGGDGLALGYRNRPELTRAAFVPNPFPEGGPVLYRTGDRVRRLPDGNIEFLGRLDGQVKLRGFRIELGEIEAILSRHPAVLQAAVTVVEREPGDKHLAAFVVCRPGPNGSAADLRAWLAGHLPAYMVPSSFQELDRLPVNTNGKLDRRALPRPGATQHRAARASFAQESLWLQDRLYPGIPAYNESWAIRLNGSLDRAALAQALDLLLRRHTALRTTFELADGVLTQVVQASWKNPLVERDVAAEDCDAAVREEAARPIDLGRDLMLRALLLRRTTESHILVLTVHHIAIDGWSLGILFRELSHAYNAFARGGAPEFPALPITPARYAEGERKRPHDASLAYWREQLQGVDPLRLPFDRNLPEAARLPGAVLERTFDAALVDSLNQLARRHNATLYMVLLAGFQALLHRSTGQNGILVGAPMANRLHAEAEGLIGYFVNTLPARLRVEPEATFGDLVNRVRAAMLAAYHHQEVPFEKLAALLQPATIDAVLVLQNTPGEELSLDGLAVQVATAHNGTAKFSLTLSMEPRNGTLAVEAQYNTGRFSAEAIARLLDSYRQLLTAVAADADSAIASYVLPGLPVPVALAQPAAQPAPEALDATIIEPALARIWRDILGRSTIDAEDNFFELGGHSLAAARLIGRVEKELGVRLSLAALFQAPTLGRLTALLRESSGATEHHAIPIQPAGTRRPFHCLSSGPMFRALAKHLGMDQPFLGVPGPDLAALPLPFRMEDLAAQQLTAIRRAQPEGPYTLGGWSSAATVAFEVARQLQAQGESVSLLVLFDGQNPTAPHASLVAFSPDEPVSARVRRFVSRILFHLVNLARGGLGNVMPYLRDRWKWGRILLRQRAWSRGYRTCLRLGCRLPGWMIDSSQIQFQCYFSYRPQPYPGAALIFRHTRRPGNDTGDPLLGWDNLLTGPVDVCDVPGDHAEIFQEPNVEVMARKLDEALRAADATDGKVEI